MLSYRYKKTATKHRIILTATNDFITWLRRERNVPDTEQSLVLTTRYGPVHVKNTRPGTWEVVGSDAQFRDLSTIDPYLRSRMHTYNNQLALLERLSAESEGSVSTQSTSSMDSGLAQQLNVGTVTQSRSVPTQDSLTQLMNRFK
jgi:hypothetical protein